MPGGAFHYHQYKISEIAEKIQSIIDCNGKEEPDEWGEVPYVYSEKTIEEFKKAVELLQLAEIYATRIDWLLSCDDGEETFHKRLKKDLKSLKLQLGVHD